MTSMRSAPCIVQKFVVNNSDLASVAAAEIAAINASGVPELELDAYDHWIFDTGNNTNGLTGRVNQRLLTLEGSGNDFAQPASIGIAGYGNSLVSTLADRDDWTIAATVKYAAAAALVGGNWAGGGGGGGAMFISAGTTGELISVVDPGGSFNLDTAATPAVGAWCCASMALDYTTGRRRTLRFQGETSTKLDDAADKTIGSRLIAFGNRYYNLAPYSTTILWLAEAIIWDRALSAAELIQLEQRQRVRAARRGISVA